MRKPVSLKRGDQIRLVSPSAPLAGLVQRRALRCKDFLESLGFVVSFSERALGRTGYVSAPAKERAEDINQAFRDPEVSAIVSLIGGYHCNQLLPFLDFDLIANNPKFLCGYSDVTVLQMAIWSKVKLVTLYGPAGMTQFAEHPAPLNFTVDNFLRVAMSSDPIGRLLSSDSYTDEFLNWFEEADLKRARATKPSPERVALRSGRGTGIVLGGCLSSLLHLAGTKFWPDFSGAILLLEIPEGPEISRGDSAAIVDMQLADLKNLGVFDQVSGVIFGRLFNTPEDETKVIFDALLDYTSSSDIPVVANLDIGHTDPMLTIPLGCQASIDGREVEIIEAAAL